MSNSAFYQEIESYRRCYENKAKYDRSIEIAKEEAQNLLKNRLLAGEHKAFDEYYVQYKDKLRTISLNYHDVFVCYIFEGKDFTQIHQRIVSEFEDDGIEAVMSSRGPHVEGFDFKNIK
jgi:hypothetical protein